MDPTGKKTLAYTDERMDLAATALLRDADRACPVSGIVSDGTKKYSALQ